MFQTLSSSSIFASAQKCGRRREKRIPDHTNQKSLRKNKDRTFLRKTGKKTTKVIKERISTKPMTLLLTENFAEIQVLAVSFDLLEERKTTETSRKFDLKQVDQIEISAKEFLSFLKL